MPKVTKLAIALTAALLFTAAPAFAAMPTRAVVNAYSRAEGNRRDVAIIVGTQLFATQWPAQVLHVEANELAGHIVLGLQVSGVHFHDDMTLNDFLDEVKSLVGESFSVAPQAEEIDIWTVVPISVGKGVIVSGDLAKPTTRTVFTITVRHGESPDALANRLRTRENVFLDEEWARTAFKSTH